MNVSFLWHPGDPLLIWGVNVLVQVTLVTAIALIAARGARRNPATRYWILCASLFLVLLTPSIAVLMQSWGRGILSVAMIEEPAASAVDARESNRPGGPGPLSPPDESRMSARRRNASSAGQASDASASGPSGHRGKPRSEAGLAIDGESAFIVRAPNAARQRNVAAFAPEIGSAQETPRWIAKMLRVVMTPVMFIWFVGTAILLARLIVSWCRLAAILRSSRSTTTASFARFAEKVIRDAGARRVPEIVLSDRVASPVSAGLLRPRVILPEWLVDRVSAEQIRDVLVHELAHVERRDQAVLLLQNLVAALFWLHPLARSLNRELAKAREEVCDNFVLATTSPLSYSRTLLTLAELVTARPLPGAVGLFTPQWKLEDRVAGLLDDQRNRMVHLRNRAKLLIAAAALVLVTVAALGTVTLAARPAADQATPNETAASEPSQDDADAPSNDDALLRGPTLRGEGANLEMLLRGRVFDPDGEPAREFELVANAYKSYRGRDALRASVEGSEFEVWVPVGGSSWMYVELVATAKDGSSRAIDGVGNRELRQAALEGVDLRLAPTNRTIEISVTHDGAPVANAYVNSELAGNVLLESKTNAQGIATLRLGEDEKLSHLTAWTDDFRIGGYQFNRKPRHDPLGAQFAIELDDCRDQTIRFVDDEDGSPIPGVPFELVIGTGAPNYNFPAVPSTFPHSRMTTDERGEATCRWFPDWESHGAYVELVDGRWKTAVDHNDMKTDDDGALIMLLKRSVARRPLAGKVSSDRFDVGGLLVEIKTFQAEEEGRSDHVYAFTDKEGNFTAECLPGATYTVCVNDGQLQSPIIDLIPYEPDTGKSNFAELTVSEGNEVEIRVTSGPRHEPMRNQYVYVRENHRYTWIENGEKRSGTGARDYPVYTDDQGVAHAKALAGSDLRINVYAGEWRSEDRELTVKEDGVTLVEFHREIDEAREVTGRLVAPANLDVELADAEIVFGSIDGETDEREEIAADAEGRFTFKTKAIQLGIFAYTADGKAAGVAKPKSLDAPVTLQLKPTMDLHGQLLGPNDVPLAQHRVRVTPQVSGKRNYNVTFGTSFAGRTFETQTDTVGNYTLENLPSELDMRLRAAPIDDSDYDAYLDEFALVPGVERPRMVSRLSPARTPDDRSLAEKYADELRDAKLGDFHLLVVVYDSTSDTFVGRYLLDHDTVKSVMSFMNLRIRPNDVADDTARQFVESKGWPQPDQGTVFVCVLDGQGNELGRANLDVRADGVRQQAADFITQYAPPQADAQEKWNAAFEEAKRTGRKVWARVGQRYCGPCFVLSRWLDDHHELLARDYVFLKIDNIRDEHGAEIAHRITSDRPNFGIPFHTIYDADGNLLIDSEGPTGNIGSATSFEGQQHMKRMLTETRANLTESEIEQIVSTLR